MRTLCGLAAIAVLSCGLGAAAPALAALAFHAEAVCIDDGMVQNGIEGGLPAPAASCSYEVNRPTGFNRRVGEVAAQAQGVSGFRSVGVDVSVNSDLTTGLPTVFGAKAIADVRLSDSFTVTGTLPLGTPLDNGLLSISAVATGQIRLDTTGAVSLNTRAVLSYAIVVGAGGASTIELVEVGELEPGIPRVINVPFVIIAVPFTGGVAIPIEMAARAELVGEQVDDSSIDARIQFGNSLEWLGITSVTDAAGNPVASFSAVSALTGTDWGTLAPIPEPRLWVLLACGIGLVALASRRARA